jgi:beta-lactamase class D
MKKILLLANCLLMIVLSACGAGRPVSDEGKRKINMEDLEGYFTGYDGCFVIYDQAAGSYTVYNEDKSNLEISPCSTFKVMHTLIGLEAGAVEDENTVFKWDGTEYPFPQWNQDLDLASAIKYSAFWCYQQIAQAVGEEKEQAYLDAVGYGNRDISGGLTQFWQQSSLKISPMEQVDMLRRIYTYDVPFSKKNIDILKKIIRLSEENGAVLSGKTGSGVQRATFVPQPDDKYVCGWFIGYVEKDDDVWFFATNITGDHDAIGSQAKAIAINILQDKGIY